MYAGIREAVLAHERVTKGATTEQLLKQVQTLPPGGDSADTSAPMEVDRVQKGGKEKGKGKKGEFKGKVKGGFGWFWCISLEFWPWTWTRTLQR